MNEKGRNDHYWYGKEKRKIQAMHHTADMENRYLKEIRYAANNTKEYRKPVKNIHAQNMYSTEILLSENDSVSELFAMSKEISGKLCVLNFASYKHPGGMFINGSCAQEECLCHKSFLFNVLKRNSDYYDRNKQDINRHLYRDVALFSDNVYFFDENKEPLYVSVLTCAAPNKHSAQKYKYVSDKDAYDALKSRIHFLLSVAVDNHVSGLVLGAYGAGVFGNDPKDVAEIFLDCLQGEFAGRFKKVSFAIPAGENYNMFREVFDQSKK